jgi:exodeoxyribonuclease VII small subunit
VNEATPQSVNTASNKSTNQNLVEHNKSFMKNETELTFEQALGKLELIVARLEESDVPLEESVKQFEEGVKLSRYCAKILEEAELRVEQVNQSKSES